MDSVGSECDESQPSRQIPGLEVKGMEEKPSKAAIEQWSKDRTTKLTLVGCLFFITLVTLIVVAVMQQGPLLHEYVRYEMEHIHCGYEGNNGYFYKRIEPSNSWLIYLESSTEVGMDLDGGGLCATEKPDDEGRWTVCKNLADVRPDEMISFNGILSTDAKNELFNTWNTVVVPWCSGFAFTSNMTGVNGFSVEGGVLLDEVLNQIDFSSADKVVLAGSGTGGLQALLRANSIKATINNSNTQAFVLADSAFFVDSQGDGEPLIEQLYHAETASFLSAACVDSSVQPKECLWPEVALMSEPPNQDVPIFIVQSWYDCWNMKHLLNIECFNSHTFAYLEDTCGDDINDAHVLKLRLEMAIGQVFYNDSSIRVGTGPDAPLYKNLGFWLTTCPSHGFLTHDDSYLEEDRWTVHHKPLQTTIKEWIDSIDPNVDGKSYMLADHLNWTDSFEGCPTRSNPTL